MLKLRFQSRIKKRDLCHRDLSICGLKWEVKFVVEIVVPLYLKQSIRYPSFMTWQCNIATVVNHGERKRKKKIKNQHCFILQPKKNQFHKQGQENYIPKYKWTKLIHFSTTANSKSNPKRTFNSYWALNTTRSHLPTSKRANCCMQK